MAHFDELIVVIDRGLRQASLSFHLLLPLWIPALVLLAIGLFGRAMAVVNFICCWYTFGQTAQFEYHADHLYSAIAFLLLFAPAFDAWSVDKLRRDLAQPGEALRTGTPTVWRVWPYTLLFVAVALPYFDSASWKIISPMWREGLGVWLPASLPLNLWLSPGGLQPFLDSHALMVTLSYAIVLLQLGFIFLMWFRPLQPVLWGLGMSVHLCLALVFPTPLHALTMMALYLVLIPDAWWEALGRAGRVDASARERFVVEADKLESLRRGVWLRACDWRGRYEIVVAEAGEHDASDFAAALRSTPYGRLLRRQGGAWARRRCERPARPPSAFWDFATRSLRVPLAIAGVSTVIQGAIIAFASPAGRAVWHRVDGGDELVHQYWWRVEAVSRRARPVLGLVPHPLLMDFQYEGYHHVVAGVFLHPDGREEWLPLVNPDGTAAFMTLGRMWQSWHFRVVGARVQDKEVVAGLGAYTTVWARKEGLDLRGRRVEIRVKKIRVPFAWEVGVLSENAEAPWQLVGELRWEGERFLPTLLAPVESF